MPSSDPVQRFEDILENIARIEGFTAGMDLEAFTQNTQALYAVKYALLTISEAAKKLGHVGTEMCPEVPWRQIQGLGNHLRHEYDSNRCRPDLARPSEGPGTSQGGHRSGPQDLSILTLLDHSSVTGCDSSAPSP